MAVLAENTVVPTCAPSSLRTVIVTPPSWRSTVTCAQQTSALPSGPLNRNLLIFVPRWEGLSMSTAAIANAQASSPVTVTVVPVPKRAPEELMVPATRPIPIRPIWCVSIVKVLPWLERARRASVTSDSSPTRFPTWKADSSIASPLSA